jgi:hypothetical protein
MEKTRKYLEDNFNHNEKLYFDCYVKLQEKREQLLDLQRQCESLKNDVDRYDSQRKQYQDMLNELNEE